MSKKVKNFLGLLWSSPVSILSWLFGLFLLVTGQIQSFKRQRDWTFVWDLKNKGWFQRKTMELRGWVGFSFGNSIFVKDVDEDRWVSTLIHEGAHCHQWYALGILFPLVYIGESVRIYFFEKDKHSYYDNRFEVEARKAAGQPVFVPRTRWKDGSGDRWAWW
jgi:hypothetical protein